MPLPRRSVYVSPEILTPFGWMSLPDAGPVDDVSLLKLAEQRKSRGDDHFRPASRPERLKAALLTIAYLDDAEMILDPLWARRIARAALVDPGTE